MRLKEKEPAWPVEARMACGRPLPRCHPHQLLPTVSLGGGGLSGCDLSWGSVYGRLSTVLVKGRRRPGPRCPLTGTDWTVGTGAARGAGVLTPRIPRCCSACTALWCLPSARRADLHQQCPRSERGVRGKAAPWLLTCGLSDGAACECPGVQLLRDLSGNAPAQTAAPPRRSSLTGMEPVCL